jgi:hypothetical protein
MAPHCSRLLTPLVAGFFATAFALADDGLWLFDRFPKDLVQKRYNFQVTDAFLEKMRLASVRFNSGGSASFISPRGLLFTNHHVGADCIQKLSSAQNDYMANGFHARTETEEKACPDLEVNILIRIEDVTAKVEAVQGGSPAERNKARKAKLTELEKQCVDASAGKNSCEAVTLYSGGVYKLHEYRKYTDVRLVFAPEYSVAAFGGDPDNFTFPRYCLDFALFRAYENGKPVASQYFFPWSKAGAKDGELVFVPGNPGSTGRLDTFAQLEYQRDTAYPNSLAFLDRVIAALKEFGKRDAESKRLADGELQSYQNSYKAYDGFLRGLKDSKLMDRKLADETKLRKAIADDPAKQAEYGKTWDEIAAALSNWRPLQREFYALERIPGNSLPLHLAQTALRLAVERGKPDAERLREYTTPAIPAVEQELFSPAPISDAMEEVRLAVLLREMKERLGADHPVLREILAGRSEEETAKAAVAGSKIKDIAFRKQLAADASLALKSEDPMMRIARILDEPARALRKRFENELESVLLANASRIARARLAAYGDAEYPDATFTLRVTFGDIRGYKNAAGQPVPWATEIGGIFGRATGVEPFALPKSWIAAKKKLNAKTPFNFVSTTDTHGGNSGSPTVNSKGEINGILFDGNIEGLPNRFVFTDETARSVHVASQGIVEALRKVYNAKRILTELGIK